MGLCLKFQHDQLLPDQKTYHRSGHRQASVIWTVQPTQVRSLQKQGYHSHDCFQMSLCYPGQAEIGLPDFEFKLFRHDQNENDRVHGQELKIKQINLFSDKSNEYPALVYFFNSTEANLMFFLLNSANLWSNFRKLFYNFH